MNILVIGGWNPEKVKNYTSHAEEIGFELAKRGHNLIASPSSGFQGLVAKAYKDNNGREFIGYYPELKLMEKMKEYVLVEPDTKIYTKKSYPQRNVIQVEASDAVIGVTGGDGTVTEIITAIKDCNLPTSFYKGSSYKVEKYREISSAIKTNLKYESCIPTLLDYLEDNFKIRK